MPKPEKRKIEGIRKVNRRGYRNGDIVFTSNSGKTEHYNVVPETPENIAILEAIIQLKADHRVVVDQHNEKVRVLEAQLLRRVPPVGERGIGKNVVDLDEAVLRHGAAGGAQAEVAKLWLTYLATKA